MSRSPVAQVCTVSQWSEIKAEVLFGSNFHFAILLVFVNLPRWIYHPRAIVGIPTYFSNEDKNERENERIFVLDRWRERRSYLITASATFWWATHTLKVETNSHCTVVCTFCRIHFILKKYELSFAKINKNLTQSFFEPAFIQISLTEMPSSSVRPIPEFWIIGRYRLIGRKTINLCRLIGRISL